MGQLFMMGFDGTTVSPQIRSLIEDYHLGSVLLSAKNLKCIYFLFPSLGTNLFLFLLHSPLLTSPFFLQITHHAQSTDPSLSLTDLIFSFSSLF